MNTRLKYTTNPPIQSMLFWEYLENALRFYWWHPLFLYLSYVRSIDVTLWTHFSNSIRRRARKYSRKTQQRACCIFATRPEIQLSLPQAQPVQPLHFPEQVAPSGQPMHLTPFLFALCRYNINAPSTMAITATTIQSTVFIAYFLPLSA